MRKFLLLIITLTLLLTGCATNITENNQPEKAEFIITDSLGNSCSLKKNARIACGYGSFSECWLLSGGKLIGVTSDAVEERNLSFDNNTEIIGTVKEISAEKLISIAPDYVILSSEISSQLKLQKVLNQAGIACGYFKIDSFEDYRNIMKQFCGYNERSDLYEENVVKTENKINDILKKAPENSEKTYLLMRAYSTGIKVKTDNIADDIIKSFKVTSIIENTPSLLDNLSVEEIIVQNPDYIFVLTMGDENAAKEYLANNIENNPAWSTISAVKNNNYIILPKELFHYKPNNRWDDSYEYIAKILYPEIFR